MSEQNNSDVILRSIFEEVIQLRNTVEELTASVSKIAEILSQQSRHSRRVKIGYDPVFDKSVEELQPSVRAFNCLTNAGVKTVLELVRKNKKTMLASKHFNSKALAEIEGILKDMGLWFGMTRRDIYNWPGKKEDG